MKKLYYALLGALLALMLGVGVWSLFGNGETVSGVDGKQLAQRPEFSFAALFDGSYLPALEAYYTDHFPMRDTLLTAGKTLNKFYYYSGSEENTMLIVSGSTGAEQGGERLDASLTQPEQTPAQPDVQEPEEIPEQPTDDPENNVQTPEEQTPGSEQPAQPEEDTPPELDEPAEEDASWAGNVIVVGTRAMEIPTADEGIITSYAKAVDDLAGAMGENTRTISLITPNGGEFYSPESLHTGEHSQKDMIEFCYSQMNDKIITVDAYSKLRSHTDEYIYFRTDHHWTQLGAYYAYTAFCEAAGFEAVPLEQFQTGRYDTFLGSMYGFTEGYPQSEVLKQHPDYLEYYLPIADTHARYYANGNLENGTPVSVVYTELGDSVSNKYLCFIGGDTPICIVESDVPGPTCIVLKESYGNAFVPFLTSHYGRIIVIDPREFNRDGKPSLNLAEFAADQGVDDLIVINYPYMINSKAFIRYLNALAGVQ